jgi:hypothetical protein
MKESVSARLKAEGKDTALDIADKACDIASMASDIAAAAAGIAAAAAKILAKDREARALGSVRVPESAWPNEEGRATALDIADRARDIASKASDISAEAGITAEAAKILAKDTEARAFRSKAVLALHSCGKGVEEIGCTLGLTLSEVAGIVEGRGASAGDPRRRHLS